MRVNLWTSGLLALAAATGAMSFVTAQEAAVPPVAVPPEEAEPAPPPSTPNPPAGETPGAAPATDTDPAPYKVLGPAARGEDSPQETVQAQAPPVVEEVPVEPGPPPPRPRRPRHAVAIVQAVDKVTAETLRFEVDARRPVRYKSLIFRVNACETEAVDEPLKEAVAHMVITSQPKAQPGRVAPEAAQVFRGWMFASSPGLNPFEHPVYDAWLIACKTSPPVAEGANL